MIKQLLLVVLIALFLAACTPGAPGTRPDVPTNGELAEIDQLIAAENYLEAAEALLALARQRPDQAAQFQLRALSQFLLAGDADQARILLTRMDRSRLSQAQAVELDLIQAEIALLDGDLATAGWLLAETSERLPGRLRERHSALELRLRELLDNPARDALSALESALYSGEFAPDLALALLIDYPLADLQTLAFENTHRPELFPWLDLVASARAYLLDDARLGAALEEWQSRHPAAGFSAGEAELWLAAWRLSRPIPTRLLIALPGEGNLLRPAAALRDGLMAAWTAMSPDRRPQLEFVYVDDHPQGAVSAWFDARERGADLMLGPLDRAQVDYLLELPDPGLPLLMFNHPTDRQVLADTQGPVSAFGLPPEEEAELAAVHALVLGHRRALVLAQDTPWGERVARTFTETFELGGGRVLREARYSTTSVDHSNILEGILELDRSAQRISQLARALAQPVEADAWRRTDSDLIFLAARPEDGRQLLPQLDFFGAGDIPVLATSQIIAGAPDARRDEDIDGVTLPLAPWFLDTTIAGQQRQRTESVHPGLSNPTLSRLYALGFDAMSLVPWLELMRTDHELYLPGLSGRLRLTEGNLIERDLPFVRLVNGRIMAD